MATDTKDRILEVAARLFAEQGYHATGVAGILRAAGVKSGSLYHFFSSKEDLLVAVMHGHLASLRPRLLDQAVEESVTGDPLEHVFALLGIYRRTIIVSDASLGCPVGSLALEVGSGVPRVRVLIDRYFDVWTTQVQAWLDAAGTRLPAALDRTSLAKLVLSVVQGGVVQARAAQSVEPFDASVSQLRTAFELLVARGRSEMDDSREPAGFDDSSPTQPVDQFEWRAW